MKWGVRRAQKLQKRADKHRSYAKDTMDMAREIDKEANSYAKAAKSATGRKQKRLNRMAESARSDADHYREVAKEYNSIASANVAKSKKIKAKHEKRGGKDAYKMVENTNTGKLIGQSLLLGSFGALRYNQERLKGVSRGKAIGVAIINEWANNMTFGAVSRGKYALKDDPRAELREVEGKPPK